MLFPGYEEKTHVQRLSGIVLPGSSEEIVILDHIYL